MRLYQAKNTCTEKKMRTQIKKYSIYYEKIFTNYTSDNFLKCKISKELKDQQQQQKERSKMGNRN